MTPALSTYSVREVAVALGVRAHLILSYIHTGELHAFNVAKMQGGRPRWRICEADLNEFIARRTNRPTPKSDRRRKADTDVIPFF